MNFSIGRIWAIMRKEFILMKRDPSVVAIMAILPLIMVCITGYAVNMYPKNVPTVVMDLDKTQYSQKFIQELKNTGYFSIIAATDNNEDVYRLLRMNKALIAFTIPANFSQSLLRGKQPAILLEDGAIDALATGRAIATSFGLQQPYLSQLDAGSIPSQNLGFKIITHRIYDPNHTTQNYVVPGMIGLVLMLTMLMITTIIAFRDVQGGTIEYLLASPARPAEILVGEILSYILVGYLQLTLGLLLASFLFHVPFVGSIGLLFLCTLPYIIAELSLGLTIATFCNSQFEAVQVVNLFIALSIILTGFNFPIFGMPEWAQTLGLFLPLTHFFKILFGIMLRGNTFLEIWPNLWPLLLFSVVVLSLAVTRFKNQFR